MVGRVALLLVAHANSNRLDGVSQKIYQYAAYRMWRLPSDLSHHYPKKRRNIQKYLVGVLPELCPLLPQSLRPCRKLLHAAIRSGQPLRYRGAPILQAGDVAV